MIYTICLAAFLIVAGLSYAGVGLSRPIRTVGGLCGIVAALFLLAELL